MAAMTGLFYLGLILAGLLIVVAFAAVTEWAERRYPRLRRWLDRHVGEEPEWRQW